MPNAYRQEAEKKCRQIFQSHAIDVKQCPVHLTNTDAHKSMQVTIKDNAYKQKGAVQEIAKGGKATVTISLKDSYGRYDFSVQ
jgi:hypothetical protein